MTTTNEDQLLLRWRREAGRVQGVPELLDVLAMAQVLLDVGYTFNAVAEVIRLPVQGGVTTRKRLREALDVANAWPELALEAARAYGADWHALREPARWWRLGHVEREEAVAFAMEFVERKGRWPTTDEFRRRFGFAVGHKGPGDAPGQEPLA